MVSGSQPFISMAENTNPYNVWISEIILQQTRAAQGLPYYKKFVKNFPNLHSLAEACQDDILKLWEGLGYYSRAINLHATAIKNYERLWEIFQMTIKK